MQHPKYPLGTQCAEKLPFVLPSSRAPHSSSYLASRLHTVSGPSSEANTSRRLQDTSVVDVTVVVSDDSFQENAPVATYHVPISGTLLHSATSVSKASNMTPYEKALLECKAALMPPHLTSQEADARRRALTLERRRDIVAKYTRPLGAPRAATSNTTLALAGKAVGSSATRDRTPPKPLSVARQAYLQRKATRSVTPPAERLVNTIGSTKGAQPTTLVPKSPRPMPQSPLQPQPVAVTQPAAVTIALRQDHQSVETPQDNVLRIDRGTSTDVIVEHHVASKEVWTIPDTIRQPAAPLVEPHKSNQKVASRKSRSVSPDTISLNVSTSASRVQSRSSSPLAFALGPELLSSASRAPAPSQNIFAGRFDAPRPLRQRHEAKSIASSAVGWLAGSALLHCDIRENMTNTNKSSEAAFADVFVVKPLPNPRPCFSSDYVLDEAARDGELAALVALRAPRRSLPAAASAQSLNGDVIVSSMIARTLATATHLIPLATLADASNFDIKKSCLSRWHRAAIAQRAERFERHGTSSKVFRQWYRSTVNSRLERMAAQVHTVSLLRRICSAGVVPRFKASSFYRFCTLRKLWQHWKLQRYVVSLRRERSPHIAEDSPATVARETSPSPLPPAHHKSISSSFDRHGHVEIPPSFIAPHVTSDADGHLSNHEHTTSSATIAAMLQRHSAQGVEWFDGYPLLLAAR
ncbi:Hypothetical protein, putative, partial [Bodo saltans]